MERQNAGHSGTASEEGTQMVDELINQLLSFKKRATQLHGHDSEMRLLHLLEHAGCEGRTVSSLSTQLHVKSPTVTQLVDRLQRQGYAKRRASELDRRSVLVLITPEGTRALHEMFGHAREFMQGLVEHLGDSDTRKLIELLARTREYFDRLFVPDGAPEPGATMTTGRGEDE